MRLAGGSKSKGEARKTALSRKCVAACAVLWCLCVCVCERARVCVCVCLRAPSAFLVCVPRACKGVLLHAAVSVARLFSLAFLRTLSSRVCCACLWHFVRLSWTCEVEPSSSNANVDQFCSRLALAVSPHSPPKLCYQPLSASWDIGMQV